MKFWFCGFKNWAGIWVLVETKCSKGILDGDWFWKIWLFSFKSWLGISVPIYGGDIWYFWFGIFGNKLLLLFITSKYCCDLFLLNIFLLLFISFGYFSSISFSWLLLILILLLMLLLFILLFSEIKLFDLVLIGCEFSSENKLDIFLYWLLFEIFCCSYFSFSNLNFSSKSISSFSLFSFSFFCLSFLFIICSSNNFLYSICFFFFSSFSAFSLSIEELI